MLTVTQLVREASVEVDGCIIGQIGYGLLILCGFHPDDGEKQLQAMLDKTLHYRIFPDAKGKMNLNIQQVNGSLLLVPQFTLLAETGKGLRPGFSYAAPPAQAKLLYTQLIAMAKHQYSRVEQGEFGAQMQVNLCNDGPVTFLHQYH